MAEFPGDAETLSRLIGDIYDASLDATLWPEVLKSTASFVDGSASALFLKDSALKTQTNIYTWGYDGDFTRIYLEKYVPLDPFTTGQFFFPIGEPICLADLMPHSEFRKSRFYAEWVRPQNWIDALGVTLEKSATTYAAFSVIRHEDQGVVDEHARRRAKLLAPHFQRAVTIGKVINLYRVEAAALADILDGLSSAMVLVDISGRIVNANAAAHDLLQQASIIQAIHGKLAIFDTQGEQALHDIFARAGEGDVAMGAAGVAIPLLARDGVRYIAHVLPLTSGARRRAASVYSAVAAVFVRKATLEMPHPIEAIAKAFKLTPTELRVLMLIVDAGGVPEVAPVLGISETTVKTHLQHIYAKTGTTRQADLVKVVASYMSPLR